ncbi:MAG: ATP-binding protein [Colwellia sp.]|nr:ATP-binding protein [Colwellia sp.]
MPTEIESIIGQSESETLEYKSVLPPSRSMAQILSGFANSSGGTLVLGVNETNCQILINGLSKDFHATSITQKAIDLLSPQPDVLYRYIEHSGKTLFLIQVEKSPRVVSVEGKTFVRIGAKTILSNPEPRAFRQTDYRRIEAFSEQLDLYSQSATGAKSKFLEHYQSVLKIVDDLEDNLYPSTPTTPTTNQEGKILVRILFSSCADNFETYLSDLLYEIYLANPNTLKSDEQITIREVLGCADIEEFVDFWAKKKLSKLQRGSVKGFIADNKHINALEAVNDTQQNEIERILQIRHLYAHKNGIIDEKFLKYYPAQFTVNQEHQMAIDIMLEKMEYLAETVNRIDTTAISKHSLATIN